MNDPMLRGGCQAARLNYNFADECYREARLSLAETGAIAVRGIHDQTVLEAASDLITAAHQHRQQAARALRAMPGDASRLDSPAQRAIAHSRLTTQAAVRSLMLLNAIGGSHRARIRLDRYVPAPACVQRLYLNHHGEVELSNTVRIFGTNRNGQRPHRPRRVALMDVAVNFLIQRTRDADFARRNDREFCDAFLEDAAVGDTLPIWEIDEWLAQRWAIQREFATAQARN